MKKLFYLTFIVAIFSLKLHAQVQIGVRAGAHWSTVHTRNSFANGSLARGFAVAVPVEMVLKNRWSIRAEPSVIQKGWRSGVDYTDEIGVPAGTGKLVLHYEVAELPVLISYRRKVTNRWAYYGLFGPSLGYALGGRLTITAEGSEIFRDQVLFRRRLEAAVWGGGGIEMGIGRLTTFLDARFQYGLSQYPSTLASSKPKENTYGFTVSLGCWLPTKK
ncbi:porin family protein [Larkinella punicea]|uniref:PorT family protein n=1 Tax=Larkinella punicea TaxID=2315727 RepID=A0A368JVE6_9BACT|nr:porin family protein [Larkinella punicea]RCR71627.1 PorT family protein [Larkinella punicea]